MPALAVNSVLTEQGSLQGSLPRLVVEGGAWIGRSRRVELERGQPFFHAAPVKQAALSCRTLQIYVPIRQFFYDLIHPDYSAVTDVYVLMFLADTVDFIIIVFGFWAFGVGWAKGLPSSAD